MVVGMNDAAGQGGVIVMYGRHGITLFGGEFVDFGGGDFVVKLFNHFHGQRSIIDVDADVFAAFFDAFHDFVETHDFKFSGAFENIHLFIVFENRWFHAMG